MTEMTQDELEEQDQFDFQIIKEAIARVDKKSEPLQKMRADVAREALRLVREGWRPEPKVDPAIERAFKVADKAVMAYHSAGFMAGGTGISLAAKVIADAIAQAVADARVTVPADVRWHVGRSHTTVTQFIGTLIAAEDGQ
jgi:hypothetical protein